MTSDGEGRDGAADGAARAGGDDARGWSRTTGMGEEGDVVDGVPAKEEEWDADDGLVSSAGQEGA